MSPAVLGQNDILGERYLLRRSEWSTPLGPVWLARDRVLDRPVHVQLLKPELAGDRTVTRAFQKAAAKIAQVTHPAVLQVFDIGEDPAFVVFEYAGGGRLSDRLAGGPLPPSDTARIALGLARGLEAMHQRGVWHGVLSPSNILLDEDGRPKMMVVGLPECAAASAQINITAEQGSGYRSRELEPMPADADAFALAAVTFHMATGRAPVHPIPAARSLRRSVPSEMDSVLRDALSDDPDRRPGLDGFVGRLAPLARVTPPDARQPRVRAGEFRWLAPVVLILLLAAAVIVAGLRIDWSTLGGGEDEPPSSPAPTRGEKVEVAGVSDFDPPPGNGEEHPEQTGRAIDGDPRSAWETLGYRNAKMAPKRGVGLLFDLGSSTAISQVVVDSTRPGWNAEIRVADLAGDDEESFTRVTSFTAATETTVPLPAKTKGRYVLLWITQLVDDGGESDFPFRAAVSEVSFFAA